MAAWRIAEAVQKRLGGIHIIVHVVGSTTPAGGFAVLDDNEWHRSLDLNLFPRGRRPAKSHHFVPHNGFSREGFGRSDTVKVLTIH